MYFSREKSNVRVTDTLHVNNNRFHNHFSTLINGMIFIQLVLGSAFISTSLFLVHLVCNQSKANKHILTSADCDIFRCFQCPAKLDARFFAGTVPLVCSLFAISPHCYFSSITALRLQRIADDIYNSMWYKMPNKYKKYHILSIIAAQKPRYFTGYGITQCSLETFKKVQYPSLPSIHAFYVHVQLDLISSGLECCLLVFSDDEKSLMKWMVP